MSQKPKKKEEVHLKIDITYSGGVPPKIVELWKELLTPIPYHLLCEEGGDGHAEHYHLHCVCQSTYAKTCNFRQRVVRPRYDKIEEECTPTAVMIRRCTDLAGALSYVYKDKRVLMSRGYDLDTIREWKFKSKPKKNVMYLTRQNAVEKCIAFAEEQGLVIIERHEFIELVAAMGLEGYRFSKIRNWRELAGDVCLHFGSSKCIVNQLMFTLHTW